LEPLISPDNSLALLAVIASLVAFGFYSERHATLSKLPGVVWILVGGTLLSNFGVIPFEAPVYGVIFGYALPLAVPLLLFKATFMKVFTESGRILPIFLLGSIAVVIGALIAFALFDLGPIEPKIAATYTAAWIGGMVNMVALSEMTQLTPTEFSIAVGASAPVSIIGLIILCALPAIPAVRKHIPSRLIDETEADGNEGPSMQDEGVRFRMDHLIGALALSALICTGSQLLINSGWFPESWNIGTYNLFIITLITVLLANIFSRPMGAIEGDFELGMIFMYFFFAAIGASTDAVTFLSQAPIYFAFGLTIILVHIALVLLAAKLLKFDLAEMIIGSGANIVGAAPAAGIASSKGWKSLVTPAIATGMLGYAIANFFGLALFKLLG
jgi:uncharacterized membrane protein